MENIFLVIPTIRDLDFLKSWKKEFSRCHLIIVEDNDSKTINAPTSGFASITHYSYQDINEDFGKNNSWIFSRKNAGIRSYGFWKAYELGADVILTLDDDCFPVDKHFLNKHLENLELHLPDRWTATYPNPKWMYTRGFPYQNRKSYPVALSHGLWSGALDLDGKTETKLPKALTEDPYPPLRQFIPFGSYYPMCSMNMAFNRDVTPLMFFPMMGSDPDGNPWGFNRYDDIWAGILSKKIMDHLRLGVVNGTPFVEHRKRSISKDNLAKESSALLVNEILWKEIDKVELTGTTPKECYIEIANKANFPDTVYFQKLKKAMIIWANLF